MSGSGFLRHPGQARSTQGRFATGHPHRSVLRPRQAGGAGGAHRIQTEQLPSINLTESVRLDLAIQKALQEQVPKVKRVISRVGSDEIGLDPMGFNETNHFLVLRPREEWTVPDKAVLIDSPLALDRRSSVP